MINNNSNLGSLVGPGMIPPPTISTQINPQYPPIALPLVRRQFPQLFANTIVGIDPFDCEYEQDYYHDLAEQIYYTCKDNSVAMQTCFRNLVGGENFTWFKTDDVIEALTWICMKDIDPYQVAMYFMNMTYDTLKKLIKMVKIYNLFKEDENGVE